MGRRPLLVLSLLACVFAAFPATALAAKARTASPTVKSVSPKKVRIGETLTIKGKNFISGKKKNSVVFSNSRKAAIFVVAERSGKTSLKVKLPEKLLKLLTVKNGTYVGTRLRLRVISRRAGKSLSAKKVSPVVYPALGGGDGGGGGGGGTGTPAGCTPGTDEGDLLPYDVEVAIKTNPCSKDTDGDGMEDGWEYQSALDLNNGAGSLPYPGKRPYPNPLDGTDVENEFDGDGMLAREEHALWQLEIRESQCGHTIPLCYSAGKEYSDTSAGNLAPVDGGPLAHLDFWDDEGLYPYLSDDERDGDGDKLPNWVEQHGPLSNESWWSGQYSSEILYHWGPYLGTDFLDADSDGDSRLDGDDDQDYDDFTNVQESWRNPRNGITPNLYVQPFNPCIPNPESRSCSWYLKPGLNPFPPFDGCYARGTTPLPIGWTPATPTSMIAGTRVCS